MLVLKHIWFEYNRDTKFYIWINWIYLICVVIVALVLKPCKY